MTKRLFLKLEDNQGTFVAGVFGRTNEQQVGLDTQLAVDNYINILRFSNVPTVLYNKNGGGTVTCTCQP